MNGLIKCISEASHQFYVSVMCTTGVKGIRQAFNTPINVRELAPERLRKRMQDSDISKVIKFKVYLL
ncbi:hypothetical protein Hamer_G017415 [Homarus americanus]|uniref:Uncharacterized protein n=1 Tax=Homarus americanus TaxID=6706 RepID=A0A8J5JS61_HOMAM|nr:hypothetical protein Hamer_G017415 [Homarus americanus]